MQVKERDLKSSIKASIDTLLIHENLKANATLQVELNRYVDQEISIEGKLYYLSYRKEYLSKVINVFKNNYEPNIEAIKAIPNQKRDQFLNTLISFYDRNDVGVFVASTIIVLKVNYNVNRISKSGIGAVLTANGEINKAQNANFMTNLLARFSVDKNFQGEATSEKILCFAYAFDLELESFGKQ